MLYCIKKPAAGMLIMCFLLLQSAAVKASKKSVVKKNTHTGYVDFDYHESLIYLHIDLNGHRDHVFLVNTGANTSVIATRVAAAMKLHMMDQDTVTGLGGKEAVSFCRLQQIQLGSAVLRDFCLSSRDLGQWKRPDGQAVDGILGMDFLQHFIMYIDFKKQKLLLQPGTVAQRQRFTHTLRFRYEDGIPVTDGVLLDTLKVPFRYNSGVSIESSDQVYVNVSAKTWQQIRLQEPMLAPQKFFTGNAVGGKVYLPVVRIPRIRIASFELKQPFVVVQPEEGYFNKKEIMGFFGNNFLEKYGMVCINFPQRTIGFNAPKKLQPKATPRKKGRMA